ncbi:MAG: hypothetical protein SFV15_12535 [Polyangiaceae bacterium]|nr:hypothetical protein [Polyangiaceae bacterium]
MQFTLGAGKSLAVILALAAASIVSGCTPPSLKYPTRSVSPQVFRDRVTTLAYSPLFTTKDAQTDQFVNAVGGQLGRRLQSIGVTLLRPEPWNECWLPAVEEAGGLYNARTGEFDEQKEARVRWKCEQDLGQRLRIDGFLEVDIIAVSAPLSQDVVRWHGVEEDTRSFGDRFWSGSTYSGNLPALSLLVRIQDKDGHGLFDNAGGLEVVGKIEDGQVEKKSGLLHNHETIARAVQVALRPLLSEEND